MLELLPSGVYQTLKKMGVMEVLHDSDFVVCLGFMFYCHNRDVAWL